MRKELEERLIKMNVNLVRLTKEFDGSFISNHLSNQILRSGTSAALNFGEAQAAESRKDFIHKMSLSLKELRETNVNLRIISESNLCKNNEIVESLIDESNQLVSIFFKAIQTMRKNNATFKS